MNILAAFFVLYVGFFIIAISIKRQRKQLLPQLKALNSGSIWALRLLGWAILGIGMALCIQYYGISIGLTLWTGLLTVAALLLSMLTLYSPRFALALLPCAVLPLVWL